MEAKATVTPYLNQSFLFDWNLPGQPVPIPVTPQCETINITWGRSTAIGPDPVPPYYFEVYTSAYMFPFVFPAGTGLTYDWPIPFYPGTLYQICMFDSMGSTGGCQATYTVIPPLALSALANCSNVTFPGVLDVEATHDNGPLSQYGWIDQCTDISVLPKNGTPPYTLTIAPALHPPYNITSNDMSSINWTVSLSYASPFFMGLYDSAGNVWSTGPLHSGGGISASSNCLSGNITSSSDHVQPVIAIGAGVGGFVAGLLIGLAVALLFLRRYYAKKAQEHRFVDLPSSDGSSGNAMTNANLPQDSRSGVSYPGHTLSSSGRGPLQYHVEPFVMPDENGRLANEAASTGGVTTPPESVSPPPASGPQQLYVLHHDSNIPPVTIFHESGTEIVELPPRYGNASPNNGVGEGQSNTDTRSDGSRTDASQSLRVHEPRQLQQIGKSGRS